MSEVRRVRYKLTGEGAPVIYLECRTIEEAREARRLATAHTSEEAIGKALEALRSFVSPDPTPTKIRGRMITIARQDKARLWSEAYIQCGPCKRAWQDWFAANPMGDDWEAWLDKAEATIRENGWV